MVFALEAYPYDERAMASLKERNFRNELADRECKKSCV